MNGIFRANTLIHGYKKKGYVEKKLKKQTGEANDDGSSELNAKWKQERRK